MVKAVVSKLKWASASPNAIVDRIVRACRRFGNVMSSMYCARPATFFSAFLPKHIATDSVTRAGFEPHYKMSP